MRGGFAWRTAPGATIRGSRSPASRCAWSARKSKSGTRGEGRGARRRQVSATPCLSRQPFAGARGASCQLADAGPTSEAGSFGHVVVSNRKRPPGNYHVRLGLCLPPHRLGPGGGVLLDRRPGVVVARGDVL